MKNLENVKKHTLQILRSIFCDLVIRQFTFHVTSALVWCTYFIISQVYRSSSLLELWLRLDIVHVQRWVHAFQSFLFNHAASLRAARLPTTNNDIPASNSHHDACLEIGDLLLVPTTESQEGVGLSQTTEEDDVDTAAAAAAASFECEIGEDNVEKHGLSLGQEAGVPDDGIGRPQADKASVRHVSDHHARAFKVVPWQGPSAPSPFETREPTINDVVLPLVRSQCHSSIFFVLWTSGGLH